MSTSAFFYKMQMASVKSMHDVDSAPQSTCVLVLSTPRRRRLTEIFNLQQRELPKSLINIPYCAEYEHIVSNKSIQAVVSTSMPLSHPRYISSSSSSASSSSPPSSSKLSEPYYEPATGPRQPKKADGPRWRTEEKTTHVRVAQGCTERCHTVELACTRRVGARRQRVVCSAVNCLQYQLYENLNVDTSSLASIIKCHWPMHICKMDRPIGPVIFSRLDLTDFPTPCDHSPSNFDRF